jgi:prepilin-type processing-associated H-X9-DG protein
MQTMSSACRQATGFEGRSEGDDSAEEWAGIGGGSSHINTPLKKACHFSVCRKNSNIVHTAVGGQSNHSVGVNAGFLDGSVKFIKDSVHFPTWRALAF